MTLVSKERAILFADVSGSTALYELLGDKPAAKAIEACLGELREVPFREPHPQELPALFIGGQREFAQVPR